MMQKNKRYLNRIVAFMMALACVVVWVLPSVLFSVSAYTFACDLTDFEVKEGHFVGSDLQHYTPGTGTYYTVDPYSWSLDSTILDFTQYYFGAGNDYKCSIPSDYISDITYWSGSFPFVITAPSDCTVTVELEIQPVSSSGSNYSGSAFYTATTIYEKFSVTGGVPYSGSIDFSNMQLFSDSTTGGFRATLTFFASGLTKGTTCEISANSFELWDYITYGDDPGSDPSNPKVDTVDVSTWECTTDLSQVTSTGGWAYDYYSCNEYYAMIEYGDTATASYDADYNISNVDSYKWRFPLIETQEFCDLLGYGTPKAYDISKLWNDSVENIFVQYDYTFGTAENDIQLALEAFVIGVDEYGEQTGTTWGNTNSLYIAQYPSPGVEGSIFCYFFDDGAPLIQSWLDISRDAATPVPCPIIQITNFSIVVMRPALEFEYPDEDPEETEPTTSSDSVDLSSVETGIENVHVSVVSGFATIRTEMAGMEDSILYGFDNVESALADLDVNINAGLDDLGQEIGADIADLGTSINQGLDDLDSSINAGLDDLDTSINQGLDDLESTISGDGTEGDVLASGSDTLNTDTDSVSDFEKEQQAVLDDNFEAIQKEVDFLRFTKALAFVQECLNLSFVSLGDIKIIYTFPLFLGMFFFLCSRVPGAVRPIRNERTRELYREEKVIRAHYRAITKKMG